MCISMPNLAPKEAPPAPGMHRLLQAIYQLLGFSWLVLRMLSVAAYQHLRNR